MLGRKALIVLIFAHVFSMAFAPTAATLIALGGLVILYATEEKP